MTKYHQKKKYPLPVLENKNLSAEEYVRLRYGTSWHHYISEDEARGAHKANIQTCQKAIELNIRDREDRGPIKILVVNGSSRSAISCAHELSNSQFLARIGYQPFENKKDVIIEEINLRDYNIEPCNGCYSTTSALCGFPCNCWPVDPMQKLYPKVLWCDVLLCSTGVNQTAMASRLKLFCDRLISLDGGYYITPEQFQYKDSAFREKMIAVSTKQKVFYDPRMFGKVAAYFISAKDQTNVQPEALQEIDMKYVEMVAYSLRAGFEDFGMQHAKNWYSYVCGKPDEDLSYDKQRLLESNRSHESARKTVYEAIELAKSLRENPPESYNHVINRT